MTTAPEPGSQVYPGPGQEHQFLVTVVLDLPPEADANTVQNDIRAHLVEALYDAKSRVEEQYGVMSWSVDGE